LKRIDETAQTKKQDGKLVALLHRRHLATLSAGMHHGQVMPHNMGKLREAA
jgi:hypothetical protein